jgi:hypothetical protein
VLLCSGKVCQRKDWGSGHKFECSNLKNLWQNAAKAAAAGNSKRPFLDPNEDAPVPQQVLFPYDLFLQLRKSTNSCRRAPVGLVNHGNNCYANAALQCMLYTKPLRAYLDQGLHSKDCNRPHDRDWCLLCVLSVRQRNATHTGDTAWDSAQQHTARQEANMCGCQAVAIGAVRDPSSIQQSLACSCWFRVWADALKYPPF